MTQTDAAVVASTAALIAAVRRHSALAYADDNWSPVGDLTIGMIATTFGAELAQANLPATVQEIGIPSFGTPAIIVVNRAVSPTVRSLALRHGLAHLVAGELEAGEGADIRFMSSILDHMTLEERRADLFALADLIPDREVVGRSAEWLAGEISGYAPAWSADRLFDRTTLRLALWRTR